MSTRNISLLLFSLHVIFVGLMPHCFSLYLDGALNNTDESAHRPHASSVTNFSKRKASFR